MLTSSFEGTTYLSNHSNTSLPSWSSPPDRLIAKATCICSMQQKEEDKLIVYYEKHKANMMDLYIGNLVFEHIITKVIV